MTLSENYGITAGKTCRKATFEAKGLAHVGMLFETNLRAISRILEWNVDNNISVYRMSSDMAPWSSEYNLEDLPNWAECKKLLKQNGEYALDNGIRLSFHPGAFTVLAGKNPSIIKKSLYELETHGKIMDYMMQPRSRLAKINIHVGGAYGNLEAAADRWVNNSTFLSDSVLSRITLENDDRKNLFSVGDLHRLIYKRTGIPIVFDYHHHLCHDGGLSEKDALELALSTWKVKPCTHYSETGQKDNPKAIFRSHSRYVENKIETYGNTIDCVIEAKAKEWAVQRYLELHG
jgi:UV DNA damage endonuclease